MKRSQFMKTFCFTSTAMIVAPNRILGQEKPAAYQKEIVKSFVGAGHNNLDKVKELLDTYPNLIYSSWDWGNGDFETSIGAAGHVGYKELANYLISKGARPTIHVLTMLGKTDLVLPILKTYPQLINSLGPHGFTLLHHARKGGKEAQQLADYLTASGLKELKLALK